MENITKSDIREILVKLAKLQKDMDYMKEHLEDITLTGEEIEAIEEYEQDKKKGKLISHKDLERELGQ
jgi:hypothetical protein